MTLDEARKVAAIIAECDGGCSVCVPDLLERCQRAFPEFRWNYDGERPYARDAVTVEVAT